VREWEAFVHAFREGLPSPVSGADGRAPLVIGLSALRSLRESRPINVEEIG
jgi:myo-inositol 2-dehydrogenase/D-chiro-inositol 1-dehydrogenase